MSWACCFHPWEAPACAELTPVTSLRRRPNLVHFPRKVVCLPEAKQLQGLRD